MLLATLLLLSALMEADGAAQSPAASNATGTRQEVKVTVRLDINELGSVDKCEVVTTDAPPKLAEGVCPVFSSKAKFKPKVDEKGSAQRTTMTQTVKFVIEN